VLGTSQGNFRQRSSRRKWEMAKATLHIMAEFGSDDFTILREITSWSATSKLGWDQTACDLQHEKHSKTWTVSF
jgi:hypothetical protein